MRKHLNRSAFLSVLLVLTAFHLQAQVGTTGQIPKFTNTTGTVADSSISEVASKVTIGTASNPGSLYIKALEAGGDTFAGMGMNMDVGPTFNFGYSGNTFGRGSGFFNVRPDAGALGPNPSLRFMTENAVRMIITKDGKVGIGYGIGKDTFTTVPTEKLDVLGNIHATGSITADGALSAKFQDIAEWVPAKTDLAPGTVVILNPERNNEVMASAGSYDTTVAGVVSVQPGLNLGIPGEGKEQIATTGRVKVRVDARSHPVRIGDLLVTSDTTGTAMRSEPMSINGRKFHQPGTIIGKALEPLASGEGEILVLLSLQ